ncbi:MAG TPA: hypothetical protein VMF70_00645 [Gemmatimonadales bacterium]|nr:hypothetical protein [Gemmatimonadales bacterium]
MSPGPIPTAGGEVSRREMLGALARWSVPTVLTIALAARTAAAASCPPCTKKSGGRCRACTMNQILNCQCEPCLGAPYCSNGARAPTADLQGAQASPLARSPQAIPLFDLNPNPLYSPYQASPFGRPYGARPYATLRDSVLQSRSSLYERLRSEQRRPF